MPGGRPKGSPNKKSKINLLAAKYDLKPLDYMLSTLNDKEEERSVRMDAAKSAAPYIHPRLASIDMSHDVQVHVTKIERKIVKADTRDR